jgi:hypothetical protein
MGDLILNGFPLVNITTILQAFISDYYELEDDL